MTTPEYSALVLEKMTQEFLGYGVIPTIRVEDYGKSS
jgi:hypothetical protein